MSTRATPLLLALLLPLASKAQTPATPFEVVVTPLGGSKDARASALCVKPARLVDARCPWLTRVIEDEPGAIRTRKLAAQVSADGATLYAVLRRSSSAGMTDELWRYRRDVVPRRLAYGYPLEFAIAADGSTVAFKDQDGVMRFVDADGKDLGEVDLAPIAAGRATLAMRDGDLAAFVVTRGLSDIARILVVDVPKREIVGYDLGGVYVGAEYAIDPRGRRLAFSDYPRGLDADGAARARAEGRVFTLQVIDLETRQPVFKAERVGEPFRPVWFGNRLSYAGREGWARMEKTFDGAQR